MRQTQREESVFSVSAGVLVFHVTPQQTVNRVPSVHQVTEVGLVAARRVLHVLVLELEDKRVYPVPGQKKQTNTSLNHTKVLFKSKLFDLVFYLSQRRQQLEGKQGPLLPNHNMTPVPGEI